MRAVPSLLLSILIWWYSATMINCQCHGNNIRLTDRNSNGNARLQICNGANWISVCYMGWEDSYASLVCRQLGFSDTASSQRNRMPEGMPGRMSVNCSGNEQVLSQCNFIPRPRMQCNNVVIVTCQTSKNDTGECTAVKAGLGASVAFVVLLLALASGAWLHKLLRGKRTKSRTTSTPHDDYHSDKSEATKGYINPSYNNQQFIAPRPSLPPQPPIPFETNQSEAAAQYSSVGPTYAVLEAPGTMGLKEEGNGGGKKAVNYEVPANLEKESDYSVL